MIESLAIVVGTAILSSALTVLFMAVAFRLWGKAYLAAQLAAGGDAMAAKVRAAVEQAAESVVPTIRQQVEAGFGAAADEALPRFRDELDEAAEAALPRFREQVRTGFKEALADAASGGVFGQAGEEIARKGGSILQTGLELLLGSEDEQD
jgi:hypothetical protein